MRASEAQVREALFRLIREHSLCSQGGGKRCSRRKPCGCRVELEARIDAAASAPVETETGGSAHLLDALRDDGACHTRGCGVYVRCDRETCPLGTRRKPASPVEGIVL